MSLPGTAKYGYIDETLASRFEDPGERAAVKEILRSLNRLFQLFVEEHDDQTGGGRKDA